MCAVVEGLILIVIMVVCAFAIWFGLLVLLTKAINENDNKRE